jgi:hypothetical protein
MRLTVMLLSLVISTQVWAGELSKPTGKVLLTLSGNIENTNQDGKADILERDCAMTPAAVVRVQQVIDDLRDQIALKVEQADSPEQEDMPEEE